MITAQMRRAHHARQNKVHFVPRFLEPSKQSTGLNALKFDMITRLLCLIGKREV